MTAELPKPPSGLRAPGKQMWNEITSEVELSSGELEVLRQACRAVDNADKLERELRKQPFTVEGYNGQPRPNPLIKILQDQQLLIRRLVDSVNIPLPEEEKGLTAAQRHAQHAARVRWAREAS
jgi:hypothetical protein